MLNIFTAAYEGKLFVVQQLIDKDTPALNEKDEVKKQFGTCFFFLSFFLSFFLDLYNLSFFQKNKNKKDDRTPLHWACSGGHGDIVNYLISKGASVNAVDDVSNFILFVFVFVFLLISI